VKREEMASARASLKNIEESKDLEKVKMAMSQEDKRLILDIYGNNLAYGC